MTPIKGLTGQKPQFPQVGQLRKGKKDESGRPIDLDYFRFTSDLPDVAGAFLAAYGEQPQLINVVLPHQTTDENWDAWYEEYIASGLVHRCDGEFVTRYRNRQSGTYITPEPNTVRCPYASGEKERNQRQGCHPTGRLQVIIPELGRLAYVMVITTSFNDIRNLDGQLRALEAIRGDLRGIPLQLRRRPDKISTPKMQKRGDEWVPTGERARRESWLLSIEAAPDWVSLQLEHQRIEALPEVEMPQIEAKIPETVEGTYTYVSTEEPPEAELAEKEPEPETEEEAAVPMTLLEALQIGLPAAAPKMGLEEGTDLAEVVKLDEKSLIDYLTKASSYKEPTDENTRVQQAAAMILDQWDAAREVVVGEPEEMEVEEGQETPLF